MRTRFWTAIALLAGVLVVSGSLYAHHGNAAFDMTKKVTLQGSVTQWVWANPHCLLMFDVRGADGTLVHWVGETQAPINMMYSGWRKNTFKAGDKISVTMEPGKNGRPIGRIEEITLPDGKTLIGQKQFKESQYAPKK
jgi:Family of unknown function (DUF6152)